MKYIVKEAKLEIPKGCTVSVKSRVVTVKGPKGELTKSFKNIKVEIKVEKNEVHITIYMTTYKQSSVLHTVTSHIRNMIDGVTKGFRYKMHEVHKHFPIDLQVVNNAVQIVKFLGGRDVKTIPLLSGVSAKKNPKDGGELWFEGIDKDNIALTCSKVFQSCSAKAKDKRKFLDGIFTSDKQIMGED